MAVGDKVGGAVGEVEINDGTVGGMCWLAMVDDGAVCCGGVAQWAHCGVVAVEDFVLFQW